MSWRKSYIRKATAITWNNRTALTGGLHVLKGIQVVWLWRHVIFVVHWAATSWLVGRHMQRETDQASRCYSPCRSEQALTRRSFRSKCHMCLPYTCKCNCCHARKTSKNFLCTPSRNSYRLSSILCTTIIPNFTQIGQQPWKTAIEIPLLLRVNNGSHYANFLEAHRRSNFCRRVYRIVSETTN